MDIDYLSSRTWAALAITLGIVLLSRHDRRGRLPPGPRLLPLVGNVFDLPRKHAGQEYSDLADKYGEVVHLNVLGQSIVVLGSQEAARELLDKRSTTYSDRPVSIMVQLSGFDRLLAFLNYGPAWKQNRRHFHHCFNAKILPEYAPVHSKAARSLLQSLISSSSEIEALVKFTVTSIAAKVTYGIDLVDINDKRYKMLQRILVDGEEFAIPGRFLAEAIPILRHLPMWFPGASFRRFAASLQCHVTHTMDMLYGESVQKLDTHAARDFVISRLLEQSSGSHQDDEIKKDIQAIALMIYMGGADTSVATLNAFLLAMAMYPDVQAKAQAELDAIIGPNRLPELSDSDSLPFVNALIKEALRWHPPGSIDLPHCTIEDDEYNGYLIPAGSIVLANLWRMSRDETYYPDPERFMPERFLNADGQLDLSVGNPSTFVFGFGRRVCPGRGFAESSLFVLCASILHAVTILPPVDKHGVPVKLEHNTNCVTLISHPEVFDYVIKPRSPEMEHLILQPDYPSRS